MGGVGSIAFKDYYLSAVLAQLPDWFRPQPASPWAQLGNSLLQRSNLKSWLLSVPLGVKIPSPFPPTMRVSVLSWEKLVTLVGCVPSSPYHQIPLESLHFLSLDLNLSQWSLKGICSLQSLLLNSAPKPFSLLQEEFGLPNSDFFSHLRISHCLNKVPLPLYAIPTKTWDFLQYLPLRMCF